MMKGRFHQIRAIALVGFGLLYGCTALGEVDSEVGEQSTAAVPSTIEGRGNESGSGAAAVAGAGGRGRRDGGRGDGGLWVHR